MTSPAQRELAQLIALHGYFDSIQWGQFERIDDQSQFLALARFDNQSRCLALAYTMQALGAQHARGRTCSLHVQMRPGNELESAYDAVWVYAMEVQDGDQLHLLGMHGERSSEDIARQAAARYAGHDTCFCPPHWESSPEFASLDAARKFYSRETFDALAALVEQGCAYLQATEIEQALSLLPGSPAVISKPRL